MASDYDLWQGLESQFRELENRAAGNRLEARYGCENGGQWTLCGSASKCPSTTAAFTALAKRGAVAAGKPGRLNDWLDLLRLEGEGLFRGANFSKAESPPVPDDPAAVRARHFSKRPVQRGPWESIRAGAIVNVILASAVYCMDRATRGSALETTVANPGSAVKIGGENGGGLEPQFPKRALWLAARLHERSWNKHDVERNNGPNHKTVQKILNGVHVREDGLTKLAEALSTAPSSFNLPRVNLNDIPTD
jgi:hypothetical protein